MKPDQPPQPKLPKTAQENTQTPEAIIENDRYLIEETHKKAVQEMFIKAVDVGSYIGEFPGLVDKDTPLRNIDVLREHYGEKWTKLQSILTEYLNQPGGKRLRPLLLFNGFRTFSKQKEIKPQTLVAGVGLELLHETSLLVDDVLDNSTLRRGQPSLWASIEASGIEKKEAKKIALDLGPLVFSWARHLMLDMADKKFQVELADMFVEVIHNLKAGEIYDLEQAKLKEWPDLDLDTNIRYLHAKSGEYSIQWPLFYSLTVSPKVKDSKVLKAAIIEFAYAFGLAFQLHDDLMILRTDQEIGKDSNIDAINNNKIALVTAARAFGSLKEKFSFGNLKEGETVSFFNKVWGNPSELTPENIQRMKKIFKETGAVEFIVDLIHNFNDMAGQALDKIASTGSGYDVSVLRYILKEGLTWMDDLDASVGLNK